MALFGISINKTNVIKIGLQLMASSQTPAELKNCKLKNLSLPFGHLAPYLGSDKQHVLRPCVTYAHTYIYKNTYVHTYIHTLIHI